MEATVLNLGPFLILVIALVIVGLVALYRLYDAPPPYEKRQSLLTDSELKFFGVLQDASGDWVICSMVRIADLLRVRAETPQRQAWQNRIHAKHVDFVLCDPKTMEAKLAIELDDRSHERPDRIARDRFVNSALAAAELPLLRVKVQDEYDARDLQRSIRRLVA